MSSSGHTVWMLTDSDSAYLATMNWLDKDSLAIQRLDRRQDRIDLLFASAATGGTRRVLVEGSDAWVDVDHGAPYMIDGGKQFLWPSERSGWRRYYLYQRDGTPVRAVTPDSIDASRDRRHHASRGEVLVTEAAPNAARAAGLRLSDQSPEGSHARHDGSRHAFGDPLARTARFLVDTHSAAARPARRRRCAPSRRSSWCASSHRTPNCARRWRSSCKPPAFFQIPMPDGVKLNAFRIVAPDFDSTKPHPVLIYVYGGPNSQMVVNNFTGSRELWHHYLAQPGLRRHQRGQPRHRRARRASSATPSTSASASSSRRTRSTPRSGSAGSPGPTRRASRSGGGAAAVT